MEDETTTMCRHITPNSHDPRKGTSYLRKYAHKLFHVISDKHMGYQNIRTLTKLVSSIFPDITSVIDTTHSITEESINIGVGRLAYSMDTLHYVTQSVCSPKNPVLYPAMLI